MDLLNPPPPLILQKYHFWGTSCQKLDLLADLGRCIAPPPLRLVLRAHNYNLVPLVLMARLSKKISEASLTKTRLKQDSNKQQASHVQHTCQLSCSVKLRIDFGKSFMWSASQAQPSQSHFHFGIDSSMM